MKERGSITSFLTVILAALLVVGLIVAEYANIRYEFRVAQADQYLELDLAMSDFHRPLFQEMGLLAVVAAEEERFMRPLAEQEHLEAGILALMDERLLLDGVTQAEDLVNDFLARWIGLELDIFDIQELNHELHQLLERDVEAEDLAATVTEFTVKLIAMKPYVELEGISLERLIDLLVALKFEDIRELAPYFVIKQSIRDNYSKVLETIRKYDVLHGVDRYERADYAVDYLGYSLTQTDKPLLQAEYLMSGLKTKDLQRPVITAELYALRLTINLMEVVMNPILREKVLMTSLGNPKLFALEALRVAAVEAYFDVNHLLERKPIPLYKGSAGFLTYRGGYPAYTSGWTYPDYLKIMLMLLPKGVYFDRLGASLEHNYEIDLTQTFTAIHDERIVTIQSKVMKRAFTRHLKGELDYVRPGIPQP